MSNHGCARFCTFGTQRALRFSCCCPVRCFFFFSLSHFSRTILLFCWGSTPALFPFSPVLSPPIPPCDDVHITNGQQNRKTAHSYRAYDYALKAAKELKDPDWALRLREATREVDKVSIDLDRAAVETLLSSGRLEAARAILKVIESLYGVTGRLQGVIGPHFVD